MQSCRQLRHPTCLQSSPRSLTSRAVTLSFHAPYTTANLPVQKQLRPTTTSLIVRPRGETHPGFTLSPPPQNLVAFFLCSLSPPLQSQPVQLKPYSFLSFSHRQSRKGSCILETLVTYRRRRMTTVPGSTSFWTINNCFPPSDSSTPDRFTPDRFGYTYTDQT